MEWSKQFVYYLTLKKGKNWNKIDEEMLIKIFWLPLLIKNFL